MLSLFIASKPSLIRHCIELKRKEQKNITGSERFWRLCNNLQHSFLHCPFHFTRAWNGYNCHWLPRYTTPVENHCARILLERNAVKSFLFCGFPHAHTRIHPSRSFPLSTCRALYLRSLLRSARRVFVRARTRVHVSRIRLGSVVFARAASNRRSVPPFNAGRRQKASGKSPSPDKLTRVDGNGGGSLYYTRADGQKIGKFCTMCNLVLFICLPPNIKRLVSDANRIVFDRTIREVLQTNID